MNQQARDRVAQRERQIMRGLSAIGVLVAAFLVYALAVTLPTAQEPRFDDRLPNPMGGPARSAPGQASGTVALADLEIAGADVHMGDVGLGVTYVPGWHVTNATDAAVSFVVGQPQVLEGCCPGPVYANGKLTEAGQELTVPPGGELLLQFPLQMHPGMDGPHHLAIPLASGDEHAALHVTGNFTATAPA